MSINERLFTTKELSQYLGVHISTIYNWLSLGLPRFQARQRGSYRFNPAEVTVWLSLHDPQTNRKIHQIKKIRSIYNA